MKVVRLEIPSGEPGTDATVLIIRQLIESGKRSLKIRYFAEWILKRYDVTARDRVGEIAAIHDWAKKNIRYVQDPYRVEYVQTPERLLVTRTGDCDDFTALVGALVESIGYPVDIKVVAKSGRKEFHHVYPVARIGAESVGLDASMPVPLGYESPQISRSKTYRSESDMLDVFSNMGLGAAPGDNDIERANGAPEGGGAVVVTGGNGTRQIPKFVNGVATFLPGTHYVVMPGKPVRAWYVRQLFERGFFVPLKGSKLTMVDFANGISEVNAIATQVPNGGPDLYHPPPADQIVLPTEGRGPGGVVGPAGTEVITPTEGAGQFGPIIYLKLGERWSGYDALLRMQTGNLRPATPNLMLVYRPNPTLVANGAGGTVTAVLRTVNENGAGVVEPTVPVTERVTVPEYDIYGEPTTQPIVVTTPGAPAPGIDTKTMLMIGGGLVVLMLLMKK